MKGDSGRPDLDELMRRIRAELKTRKAQKSFSNERGRGAIFERLRKSLLWQQLSRLRIMRGLLTIARGILLLPRIPLFDALLAAAERRVGRLEERTEALAARQEQRQNEVARISEQLARLDTQLVAIDEKLELQTKLGHVVAERDSLLDAFYLRFEDRYCGTASDINERQRVYLPHIQLAVKATGGAPVIDLGCGRGEWLELLGENSLPARGYDLNGVMVEACLRRGLDVNAGDALAVLRSTPNDSLAAVTGFHLIEHLSFDCVVELVDQSVRVLREGGVLIFETPNPANLQVAMERFLIDPTHRKPLPSELVSFLVAARGFSRVEVRSLHPIEWSFRDYDDPMLAVLQRRLFGPQDYNVIGWKDR